MTSSSRRDFLRLSINLGGAAAMAMFPPAIRKALAIPANNRTGTLEDVEHIVIFMQENRAFDHYFGSLHGVRGFGDRFPIPVPDAPNLVGKTVWYQRNDTATGSNPKILTVQHNDTTTNFSLMRTADTPHLYPDAQNAWDAGRMTSWPQFKNNASMVYYTAADMPFQFALADAFTICDAYHSAFTGGTNPNRCFLFTGTNHGHDDPTQPGIFNGPAMDNSYNALANGSIRSGYTWPTYAERLEAAGVSWQVYQNEEKEFFALNSLLGFRSFREANTASTPTVSPTRTPLQQALYEKGIRTRDLDLLKADVLAGTLPQVSWICATSSGSEHPSASSPAQGAAYIAQVLNALTANPDVWSKTVLLLDFDENDGFFDHVPPPAPPSYITWDPDPNVAILAGASTVDASDEYLGDADGGITSVDPYKHHPFGLGPRVPMYVISPWSKGGWVNSQVFDHTSTIRFVEKRFGVSEPNVSDWRRSVSGDLTSCFNFADPNDTDLITSLPNTAALDAASRALGRTVTPAVSLLPVLPIQDRGVRPSRALLYELHVTSTVDVGANRIQLVFENTGAFGAVFQVYNRNHLTDIPRRYTVAAGKSLSDGWDLGGEGGAYDLWVLGPNGFHRHFTGSATVLSVMPDVQVGYDAFNGGVYVKLHNTGNASCTFTTVANAYYSNGPWAATVAPLGEAIQRWALVSSGNWYDFTVTAQGVPAFTRRFAGRVETKRHSVSDPAMGGPAVGDQLQITPA
jgi:phospholipase C